MNNEQIMDFINKQNTKIETLERKIKQMEENEYKREERRKELALKIRNLQNKNKAIEKLKETK